MAVGFFRVSSLAVVGLETVFAAKVLLQEIAGHAGVRRAQGEGFDGHVGDDLEGERVFDSF